MMTAINGMQKMNQNDSHYMKCRR